MHALHGCCMTSGCKNYDSEDWDVATIMIHVIGKEKYLNRSIDREI